MKRNFTFKALAMKCFLVLSIISLSNTSWAQTPPDGLTGEALREWIKENFYTGKRNVLSYSNARISMYGTIDVRANDSVYCVYTGFHQLKENTSFLDPINAEHTVPQSWFGGESNEPLRTDIHHLYPTHGSVNTARSNNPFDEIVDSQTESWYIVNSTNTGLSVISTIPTSNIDDYSELVGGSRFEPREDHKGDLARAVFYIYTMYPGEISELSNLNGTIEDIADPQILLQWSQEDPVDAWELQRNDRTEAAQGNRNPYIDNPDWIADAFLLNSSASITVTASLTDFGSIDNGSASSAQTYTVQGTDLAADLTVSASENFQVSKDGSTFSSSIVFAFEDVNASAQTVHVRFEPVSGFNGVKTGIISHSSSGAASREISVSGSETGNSGTTAINLIRNSVDENGLPTVVGEVTVQGIFHGINTNPGGANGFDFQFTLIDETAGINVRYDEGATDLGTYQQGDEVTVVGEVNHFEGLMQIIPTSVSLVSSGNPRKTPTTVLELDESTESDLVKLINVTIPTPSEWTGNASNSSSFNVNITASGNAYTMRIDGDTELAQMTYSDVFGSESVTTDINLIGLGGQFDNSDPRDGGYQIFPHFAADITIGAAGIITTSVSSLENFGTISNGNTSEVQTYTVSGSDLTSDVTITAPSQFEISTDGTSFSSSLTLAVADVNSEAQTIHARFAPNSGTNGNASGNITHESTDVVTINVEVFGTETGNAGNTPPSDIALDNNSIAENLDDGTVIGGFSTEDVDSGDTHTYSLVNGVSDNNSFAISGTNLISDATFNFESKSSYTIKVSSDDGNGGTVEKEFNISITDANDNPSSINLSNSSIDEAQAIGSLVGAFVTTDEDSGDSHSYSLVSGDGDSDNASFSIDGSNLLSAEVFDFATKSSYSVRVQSDDGNGGTTEASFTISVNDPANAVTIFINEVDADQTGTDTEEFVELYDGGVGNTSLDGLVLVLYNGSNNTSYSAFDLDGHSTDANGFFVIGASTVTNVDYVIPGTDNLIQNGADAVTLYTGNDTDFPNGTAVTTSNLIDALVYDTNDGDDAELLILLNSGQAQINEDGGGNKDTHSNSRVPDGGTLRNTDTYTQKEPTPGASNDGSSVNPVISTSVTSLNDFGDVIVGRTSDSQTYTVSGTDLTSDLTVTAPQQFKVSKDGTTFSGSITFAFADLNSAAQTVHIHFAPTGSSAGAVTGNIIHSSSGATGVNVSVSGNLVTGLEDVLKVGIEVYPVPASDKLQVKLIRDGVYDLTIFDLKGRNIFTDQISKNTTIDVSGIENGLYIFKISNQEKSATLKLMIRH